MPTKSQKRAPSVTMPRTRSKPPKDDLAAGLGLALFLGGAAALLATALADKPTAQVRSQPQPKPRHIVAGIDLTDVDLSQPFWVDFSVPLTASTDAKRQAIERVRMTLLSFNATHPDWYCQVLGSVDSGQFGLHVTPLAHNYYEPRNI